MEETVKIRILSPTFVKGNPVKVGEEYSLTRRDALDLMGAGQAKRSEDITAEDEKRIEILIEQLKITTACKKELHKEALHFAKGKNHFLREEEFKKIVEEKAQSARQKAKEK